MSVDHTWIHNELKGDPCDTAMAIAKNQFRRPDVEPASDAAKLQAVHGRQTLRQRERKLDEEHECNRKRANLPLAT